MHSQRFRTLEIGRNLRVHCIPYIRSIFYLLEIRYGLWIKNWALAAHCPTCPPCSSCILHTLFIFTFRMFVVTRKNVALESSIFSPHASMQTFLVKECQNLVLHHLSKQSSRYSLFIARFIVYFFYLKLISKHPILPVRHNNSTQSAACWYTEI